MRGPVQTEGVVLKAISYRESSKIVTIYTKEFGKVKALAKGARQLNSRFGAALEPLSYVSLVIYRKEHRDIQLMSQCDTIRTLRYLTDDLGKMAPAMSIIELVDKVSHDEEKNEPLFRLVVDALESINGATKNPRNILCGFEVRLASLLGFQPQFDRCIQCGESVGDRGEATVLFHVTRGGPLCAEHAGAAGLKVRVSREALAFLRSLLVEGDLSALGDIAVPDRIQSAAEGLIIGFLRYHVESLHALNAPSVTARILE